MKSTLLSATRSALNFLLPLFRHYPTRISKRQQVIELIHSLVPVVTTRQLIRLGPPGDGGYLVPDDLDGIVACFSPGVSLISGFELDCANLGIPVFLADASVSGPPIEHKLFFFQKRFIGATTDAVFLTLDDWISRESGGNQDLILQIDIEGFEYEALLSASDGLMARFRIIVIEFHDLDMMWSRPAFSFMSATFKKLLQTHQCVHIHPNNCRSVIRRAGIAIPPVMEFTFYRKDRADISDGRATIPHPLDFDNTVQARIKLSEEWTEGSAATRRN